MAQYLARKPAKALLPRPPLPSEFWCGFWRGTALLELDAVSPDRGGFVQAFLASVDKVVVKTNAAVAGVMGSATGLLPGAMAVEASALSSFLGGVACEEGSMWYCVLKAAGVTKVPEFQVGTGLKQQYGEGLGSLPVMRCFLS